MLGANDIEGGGEDRGARSVSLSLEDIVALVRSDEQIAELELAPDVTVGVKRLISIWQGRIDNQ